MLGICVNCSKSADWVDTRVSGPFICRADFSLAGLQGVLNSFASLETDLHQFLGIPPGKEPIEIYLFHDKATYTAYLKRYVPGVPNRRALYVKGQGAGGFSHTGAGTSRSTCGTNVRTPCCMPHCRWCHCGSTRDWHSSSRSVRHEGPVAIRIWTQFAGTSAGDSCQS